MRYTPWIFTVMLVLVAAAAAPVPAPSKKEGPVTANKTRSTDDSIDAKTQALLDSWKDRLKAEKFNYTTSGPFVIAGDASAAQLKRYRDGTILSSQHALHAMYFKTEPAEPILILLFETEEPYKRLAKKWFKDDDVPHFGFFRPSERVMLMNISTGTGTLVHELVHALMAPDFPDVPDWFNEGLASLYEQSYINGDTIRGGINWRVPGLQKTIKADRLRSLQELIEDPKFYAEDNVGINYAQARYLMMYLQRKELLTKYYAEFRDNVKEDPTGLKTLKKIIAPKELDEFEKEWREWVMTLDLK